MSYYDKNELEKHVAQQREEAMASAHKLYDKIKSHSNGTISNAEMNTMFNVMMAESMEQVRVCNTLEVHIKETMVDSPLRRAMLANIGAVAAARLAYATNLENVIDIHRQHVAEQEMA